ncbi:MAG: response regulator [Bdellovibrionaceae bacterium]|nr:response regulator [Pseudobdellovibrionaceae bacterium]
MKILLAEDDINISKIAKMTLEHFQGHDVHVVHDGAEALEKALTNEYDLILLDEMMPKLNGVSVCISYKEQSTAPIKPIIFLSAKSQQDQVSEFTKHGLGFIPKPFDPQTLWQEIENILKDKGFSE